MIEAYENTNSTQKSMIQEPEDKKKQNKTKHDF